MQQSADAVLWLVSWCVQASRAGCFALWISWHRISLICSSTEDWWNIWCLNFYMLLLFVWFGHKEPAGERRVHYLSHSWVQWLIRVLVFSLMSQNFLDRIVPELNLDQLLTAVQVFMTTCSSGSLTGTQRASWRPQHLKLHFSDRQDEYRLEWRQTENRIHIPENRKVCLGLDQEQQTAGAADGLELITELTTADSGRDLWSWAVTLSLSSSPTVSNIKTNLFFTK